MAEFSKMDTQALIAAALAPAPDVLTPRRRVNDRMSSKQTPHVPQQDEADQKAVKGGSVKRRRGESTASLECSEDKDSSSAAQQTPSRDSDSLASALTGDSGKLAGRKTTGWGKYRGDYNPDDTEDEDHDDEGLPIVARTRQKANKAAKPVSSDTISRKELAGLGIDSSRLKRKSKSGPGQIKRRDGRQETEAPITSIPANSHQDTPKHSQRQKKIRQLLSSSPSTPSQAGSPMVSPSSDEASNDSDFDDDSNSHDDLPAPKKLKKNTSSATLPAKGKANSKGKGKGKGKAKPATPGSKRSASAKNRTYNFPVAASLTEASEADKMMFRWKGEGKSWKEITAEWGRITGKLPGPSSLSVRYIKLKEKFSKMGDPDFARLLQFKASLEQTFEATEKWDRIAAMIEDDGGGSYSGQTLKAKFRNMIEEEQLRSDLAGPVILAAAGGAGCGKRSSGGGQGPRPQVIIKDLDDMDYELMGIERPGLGGEVEDVA